MNLLEIIVIIITIILAVSGFQSGFVKKLASMLSLIISIILVSAFLPTVTDFIKDNTPLYSYIETQCWQWVSDYTTSSLGFDVSNGGADLSNLGREEIAALLEEYGYGSYVPMLDALSDEELEQYKDQYFSELIGEQSDLVDEGMQTEIIDELPLPNVVRNLLHSNNNEEGYLELNVSGFVEYIVEFLSTLILDVISFIIAIILVQIVLHVVIAVLNVLAHFPVISIVNRVAGLGLGLLQALFFLWIFFLVLAVLQTTEIGSELFLMVEQSQILSWLYESNLFWNIFITIF